MKTSSPESESIEEEVAKGQIESTHGNTTGSFLVIAYPIKKQKGRKHEFFQE
jgi:hypothetical protein